MKKNANYEINFATNTITVTKRFLAAASELGSEAYQTMIELRALGMNICAKEVHRGPCRETRWSVKRMENFLKRVDDEKHLADFRAVKESSPYMTLWAWFKKNIPNYDKVPELNDSHKIIVAPIAYYANDEDAA